MPQFNRRELDERSRQYGVNRDTFEKVLRLKIILEYFNSQDYLKEHLLLKGGTAINLTIFNLPRLSVDIDLDFVPNLPREETMSAREAVSDIIRRYMSEQGYSLSEASRFSHSLDAFHYNYTNAAGNLVGRKTCSGNARYFMRRFRQRRLIGHLILWQLIN